MVNIWGSNGQVRSRTGLERSAQCIITNSLTAYTDCLLSERYMTWYISALNKSTHGWYISLSTNEHPSCSTAITWCTIVLETTQHQLCTYSQLHMLHVHVHVLQQYAHIHIGDICTTLVHYHNSIHVHCHVNVLRCTHIHRKHLYFSSTLYSMCYIVQLAGDLYIRIIRRDYPQCGR